MHLTKRSYIAITIDLDWASESAIDDTLQYFSGKKLPVTVFATHNSEVVAKSGFDVGLHPFFGKNSSHGTDISDVVINILQVPHNLKVFRSHRFENSNETYQAMLENGFYASSNICTDLELLSPFYNRFQMLEVPIFLEDGGYLFNKHPLQLNDTLKDKLLSPGLKTIVIHPMHFNLNTPEWEFMVKIKEEFNREQWNSLLEKDLKKIRSYKQGIRNFMTELVDFSILNEIGRASCRERV